MGQKDEQVISQNPEPNGIVHRLYKSLASCRTKNWFLLMLFIDAVIIAYYLIYMEFFSPKIIKMVFNNNDQIYTIKPQKCIVYIGVVCLFPLITFASPITLEISYRFKRSNPADTSPRSRISTKNLILMQTFDIFLLVTTIGSMCISFTKDVLPFGLVWGLACALTLLPILYLLGWNLTVLVFFKVANLYFPLICHFLGSTRVPDVIPYFEYPKTNIKPALSDIIHDLIARYNFNPNNIFVKVSHDFNAYAYQTYSSNNIVIHSKLLEAEDSLFKFVLFHEYGHIYNNHSLKMQYMGFLISAISIALIVIQFKRFLDRKTSRDDVTYEAFGILASAAILWYLSIIALSIFQQQCEFQADAFSNSVCGKIDGVEGFIKVVLDEYSLDGKANSAMFYPPMLPFQSHPSVYHRYLRSIDQFKNIDQNQ